MYSKCHKKNPNHGWSYIDSPDWIRNKRTTINPTHKTYNKCFQYAVTFALNHKEIGKHTKRIAKIKRFVNKYKGKGIKFPSEKEGWKKIEKNSLTFIYFLDSTNSYNCLQKVTTFFKRRVSIILWSFSS